MLYTWVKLGWAAVSGKQEDDCTNNEYCMYTMCDDRFGKAVEKM